MYSLFASVTLFDSGSIIVPFLFFVTGAIMIAFDFRNRRLRTQHPVWYQRFWIVLGVIQLVTGGMVLIFSNILPFFISQMFSSTILLLFLLIICVLGIYTFILLIRTVFKLSIPHQAIHIGDANVPGEVSVAASPLLLLTRILIIVEICFLIILSLSAITPLYALVVEHQHTFYGWMRLLAVPLLGFFLYRTYMRLRYLQRLEPLRFSQAAKEGDDNVPVVAEPTFSMPIMITERIKRIHIGLLAFLALLLMVPGTLPMISSPSFGMFSLLFFFFLIFGITALVITFLPFFIARNTINATENGLRDGFGGFVSWQEASLFVCYRLPGFLGDRATTVTYELSSPSRVVRWNWICAPQSPFTILEPQLPIDVYYQRMQVLSQLVMTKTGLPLHDLSQLIEEK